MNSDLAPQTAPPRSDVVILGASNVSQSLRLIVESLRRALGPAVLRIACGHGRSYGRSSAVLWRTLPGILDCGLCRAADAANDGDTRPPGQRLTLLTDIGNDLMYGESPETIAGWVDTCIRRRLGSDGANCGTAETASNSPAHEKTKNEQSHDAANPRGGRVLIVGLPTESLLALSRLRYEATRRLFFPLSGFPWAKMKSAIRELDDRLRDVAERHGAGFLAPDPGWYGFDPIHIRRGARAAAWTRILSELAGEAVAAVRPPLSDRVRFRKLRPEVRRLAGMTQRTPQPVARFSDGSELSLF